MRKIYSAVKIIRVELNAGFEGPDIGRQPRYI